MTLEPNVWQWRDPAGVIYPWYTKPCLDWMQTRVQPGMKVFEYGTGSSTVWYASRGCVVTAVDDNATWVADVKAEIGENPNADVIMETDADAYVKTIGDGPYDIVVIDGSHRTACLSPSLAALRDGGWLIIDNMEYYREPGHLAALDHSVAHHFPQCDHPYWTTAIFEWATAVYELSVIGMTSSREGKV